MKDKLTRHNNHKIMFRIKRYSLSILNIFSPFVKLFSLNKANNAELNIAK